MLPLLLFVAASSFGGGSMDGESMTTGLGGSMGSSDSDLITVTITSHADGDNVEDASITVTGTATGAVSTITCTVDTGGACDCTGTTSWSCTVEMAAGQDNVITVSANGGAATDVVTVDHNSTLHVPLNASGPAQMATGFGTCTLVLDCDARDGATCDTGGALTVNGSPTTGGAAPFIEAGARRVDFGTSDTWSDTSLADIANEDFVIEWVGNVATNTGAAKRFTGACSSGNGPGWCLYLSAGVPRFRVGDGSANVDVTVGANGSAWNYLMAFGDNDGNLTLCQNGACGTPSSMAALGSLTTASSLTLGSTSTFMARVRVWRGTDCLDGVSVGNEAAWAAQRLFGMWADVSAGAANPSTMTRASTAYITIDRDEDGEARMFNVGNNWMRLEKRLNQAGDTYFTGVNSEPAATNLLLYSEDLTQASAYVLTEATISSNARAFVDGRVIADDLIPNTNNAAHYVNAGGSTTLSIGVAYAFSVFARPGDKEWIRYTVFNGTDSDGYYFHLTGNGSIGSTVASPTNGYIEPLADGWYRLTVQITAASTSAAHYVIPSTDDGDAFTVYTGDGATADISLAGFQATANATTSYIVTTSSTGSRSADRLEYPDTDNYVEAAGTLHVEWLCPDYDETSSASAYFLNAYAAANTLNAIQGIAASDAFRGIGLSGGATQWSITGADIFDGAIHDGRVGYASNDIQVWLDDVSQGTDTSATPPTGITLLAVGSLGTGASQPSGCLIGNVRIWDERVTP